MAAIELDGVTKRFGGAEGVLALDGVDLTVEEGEVYGFLGPNGAGKSTSINVLLDFVRPTEGRARVLGLDAHEESLAIRERIGVLPEGYSVYDRLTARQHLEFAIDAKGADQEPGELLARVGLDGEDASRKAGDYSKGMRQRLVLAMALVGEPELLVLDEPSTGLDPNGAREMRRIVDQENERGATVFFSSHILSQVEAVCDRVGILNEGQLVAEDTVEGLRDAMGDEQRLVVQVESLPDEAVAAARAVDGVSDVTVEGTTLTVACDPSVKRPVMDALEEAGALVTDFSTEEASLDELFAAYTEDDR